MYGVSAVERADAVRQQLAEDGHALVCRWSAGIGSLGAGPAFAELL